MAGGLSTNKVLSPEVIELKNLVGEYVEIGVDRDNVYVGKLIRVIYKDDRERFAELKVVGYRNPIFVNIWYGCQYQYFTKISSSTIRRRTK